MYIACFWNLPIPEFKGLRVSGNKYSVENIYDDFRNKLDSVLAKSFSSAGSQEVVNLSKIKSSNKLSVNHKIFKIEVATPKCLHNT